MTPKYQVVLFVIALTFNSLLPVTRASFPNILQCLQKVRFDRQVFLNNEVTGDFYVTDETLLENEWTHDMHAKSFEYALNKNDAGRLVMTGFQLVVSAGSKNLPLSLHGNQDSWRYAPASHAVDFPQDLTDIKSVYNRETMHVENLIFVSKSRGEIAVIQD